MTSVARREHDDSGEYSDASQDIDHNNSGNEVGQPESDYDSQGSDSERSDRDHESQETERRVDDDEDRSNPQYIPKRGTFYEHDDRTAASGEESSNTTSETASEKKEGSETPAERRRAPRKSDVINKWSHDKYNENEQMPKSRDELVAIYGYDIRNEDAPPHARRNRRYGRGPNKYTRTWEDEEAYKRQSAAQPQPRKPPNPDEFPELDASKKQSKRTRGPRPRSKSQPASNESLENGSTNQLRRNASIKTPKGKNDRPVKANVSKSAVKPSPKPSPKDKMPPLENLTITTTLNTNNQGQPQRKVNTTVAQQRPVPTEQAKRKPQQQPQQPNNVAPNKSPQLSPPQPQQKPQPQQNQQPPQPATGGEARGGSKRYSSLRQRPLAESYSPQQQQTQQQQQQQQQQPQQQQQIRYTGVVDGTEYPAGAPPAPHQGSPVSQMHPPLMHQQVHRAGVPPQHGPSPPHQQLPQPQHSQQVRLGLLEQQQLVSHPHPLHNMPQPHAIGQLQATQGYAPPAMMPAQYMQPAGGGGSGGVFGGAMYAQPPAPYPMYPHHNYQTRPMAPKHEQARGIIQNYLPPGPAPDLLAGGVTYYNCAEQEQQHPPQQQPRAQRRPTAAIPIVRPAAPERAANSTEKDNIDRIVENMFVRKPWPATHGADSKDKPSESRSSQEPPSKDSSQPNSLTSSSISTDSKPSETKEERTEDRTGEDRREEKETQESEPPVTQETIQTDA